MNLYNVFSCEAQHNAELTRDQSLPRCAVAMATDEAGRVDDGPVQRGVNSMTKSKLTDAEILTLFKIPTRIGAIAVQAGVSRQAIHAALKRTGEYDPLHGSSELVCRFCGEKYRTWRSSIAKGGDGFGYCSIQCFHADRSKSGEYSKVNSGGIMSRLMEGVDTPVEVTDRQMGRCAAESLADAGIVLNPGEVVHYRDLNRGNNSPDNLQVFKSQSEHMQFHHALRAGYGALLIVSTDAKKKEDL